MQVLVTGASGFIGRHVVDRLASSGHVPFPFLRPESRLEGLDGHLSRVRRGAFSDLGSCVQAVRGMDAVIHLAGLTRAKNQRVFDAVNRDAVGTLLAACREGAPGLRRFVLVSSLAAGGPAPASEPRVESDPPAPVTPYGRSKLRGEQALHESAGSIPWTIVRPPIVYGPWERDLLALFRLCLRGPVPVVGLRPKSYSVVFGPDLARALVDLMEVPGAISETFHVSEDRTYTYAEMVDHLAAALGVRSRKFRVPHLVPRMLAVGGSLWGLVSRRPPLVNLGKLPEILAPGFVCSSDKVRKLLPGVASTSFAEGARLTAAWYREKGWLPN